MTKQRKLVRAQINALGDDEVEVVMSTAALARDGHILLPQGCRIDNYRSNPIVLWSHDPDEPVGNAEDVTVEPDKITARVRFAQLGISTEADKVRGLVKTGVIRAVSIGFDPLDGEPIDPKKPRGGQRISDWELFELSFVSVPSDTGAVVTNRAHGDDDMADHQVDQDQGAAGDKAAGAEAQDGARKPKTRDNRKGGRSRATAVTFTRGIYQVAQMCSLFSELGYQVDWAAWEAECEGDGSKVPAMLAAVFHDLGDALIAMTQEEIAEALAGCKVEPYDEDDDVILVDDERAHIAAGKTPMIRQIRRAQAHAKLRAGKTLSDETVRCMREALASHEEAMTEHRSAMRKHRAGIKAISDLMDRAGVSDPDSDTTQTIQNSEDVDVSEGSENGRTEADFQTRQAALRALAAAD